MKPGDTDYDVPLSEDLGQVTINNDVVARVAALAAVQVPGVSVGGKFNIGDFLTRKEPVRGVTIEIDKARTRVSFEIKVEYGQNMYEVAHRLQRCVKDAVERMTGLVVDQVNVAIVDILAENERRDRGDRREGK